MAGSFTAWGEERWLGREGGDVDRGGLIHSLGGEKVVWEGGRTSMYKYGSLGGGTMAAVTVRATAAIPSFSAGDGQPSATPTAPPGQPPSGPTQTVPLIGQIQTR